MLASSPVSALRSVGSYDASTRPASMREKSSSVLTSFERRSAFRCTNDQRSRSSGDSVPAPPSASSAGPSIKVSGVRNS